MSIVSTARRWRKVDRQRSSYPGEHWLVFAAGVVLLAVAARRRNPLTRWLAGAAGSALLARAASGRDGIRSVL